MAVLKKEKKKFFRRYDRELLCIEAWGENALRIRVTKNCEFDKSDRALLPAGGQADIQIDGQKAEVKNGKIKAVIAPSGKISFYNQDDKLLLTEYLRTEEAEGACRSLLKIEAREMKPLGGNDFRLVQRFEPCRHEKIYGMGQYQQDFLNLKGLSLELAQRNSQASVPFYISDQGYGFLWNNPAIGEVMFGRNITSWKAASATQLDYWITAGDSPHEILSSYTEVTGRPPMMPEYAMGFWQCKLRYKTQDELIEVAREYHRRNIPLSVIVIDYFHWPNQGTWTFDKEYWPDPEKMVRELKEMGIELMVSVWPTVDTRSPNYKEMLEKGLLASTDRGLRTQMDFYGNEVFYDVTNPEARRYVWEKIKKNYYEKGIKTFWLDVAEPEYSTYDFELYRYAAGSNMQVGNSYPLFYAKNFYDGLKEEGETEILNLLRCAWAGSQRYGALVWSGDIHSGFASLRAQVCAGLNMAMAGIPWWTTDIGGFNDGNINDPSFIELLIRWFQYGTFCPVMRLHGYRLPYEEPMSKELGGGMCDSGAANEIWSFGKETYEILKTYIELRERLRPYIRELMKQAHETGTPPMRPLFYDFPEDAKAWDIRDAYMFGANILAAPVLCEGVSERDVYLPEGTEWTELISGKKYQGGRFVKAEAPLERMPIFINDEKLLSIFSETYS